jgi:predicted membrane channel-forming protein YqfA (hemolysin III family)
VQLKVSGLLYTVGAEIFGTMRPNPALDVGSSPDVFRLFAMTGLASQFGAIACTMLQSQ